MKNALPLIAMIPAMLMTGCSDSNQAADDAAPAIEAPSTTDNDTPNVKQIPVETATPEITSDNRFAAWEGKWTGPEGMYVNVKPIGGGRYELEMQSDLDTKGRYPGNLAENGIGFTRDGEKFLLYRASGDETGLKYLADKEDCLMVKPGEGYCRD